MKKQRNYLFFVLLLLASLYGSCSINPFFSVGVEVDLEPPVVQITSNSDFEFVSGTFNLSGTFSDNKPNNISKIRLSIYGLTNNIKKSNIIVKYIYSETNKKNGTWSHEIITGTNGLPDGDYCFTVQAYDIAENASDSSTKSVTLTVDNAPSNVTVSYPQLRSTPTAWDNSNDIYDSIQLDSYQNGEFYIKGSIEEQFTVKDIYITLTELDENKEPTESEFEIHIDSNKNISSENRMTDKNYLSLVSDKTPTIWAWRVKLKENAKNDEIIKKKVFWVKTEVVDAAGNKEPRKQGYFCILPQADYPYTNFSDYGDKIPVSTPLTGQSCDDDGIKSIKLQLCNKNGEELLDKVDIFDNISTTDTPVRTYNWNTQNSLPTIGGDYILKVFVTDINGKSSWSLYSVDKFVHPQTYRQKSLFMMDLSAPTINILGAKGNKSISSVSDAIDFTEYNEIVDNNGDFTIVVNATDASAITKLYIAKLLSTVTDENRENLSKIDEESGNVKWNLDWQSSNEITQNGITFYRIVDTDAASASSQILKSKCFNVFSDFNNEYTTKTFYVYAENASGKTTVSYKTLYGETNPPEVTITSPTQSSTVTANFNISFQIYDFTGIKDFNITVKQKDINIKKTLSELSGYYTTEDKKIIISNLPSTFFATEEQYKSGSCTISVQATDFYGNVCLEEKNQFYIEKERPYIKGIYAANNPISTYKQGDLISIKMEISKPVTVSGTPSITLGDIGEATYISGSGTNSLLFNYTVGANKNTTKLNATAFNTNGATIEDDQHNQLENNFPASGTGSLSSNATIKIDTNAPTIQNIKNITPNGSYSQNSDINSIELQVIFSESVSISGTPKLKLNASANSYAIYDKDHASNAANKAVFIYNIANGDNVEKLEWTNWVTNDSTIYDFANSGNDGLGNALVIPTSTDITAKQWTGKILIDTTTPTLVGISSQFSSATLANGGCFDDTDNRYYCNAGKMINLVLTFSENVYVSSSESCLTFNGLTTTAKYSSGSGSNKLTFSYTVKDGDNVELLKVNSIEGVIYDVANNQISNEIPTTIDIDKNYVIDTTAPTAAALTFNKSPNTTENGKDTFTGLDSSNKTLGVTVTATATNTGAYWYRWSENSDVGVWISPLTNTASSSTTQKTFGSGENEGFFQEYVVSIQLKDKAGNESTFSETKTFIIDTDKPSLIGASSETVINNAKNISVTGTYTNGETIFISLVFNKDVTTTSPINITLNNGKTVTIPNGKSTTHIDGSKNYFLTTTYTVAQDEILTTPLNITSITSGSVKDCLENVLNTETLNSTVIKTGFENINASQEIKIDSQAPTLTSIVTTASSGWYTSGKFIPITLTFSEAVKYISDTPSLTLNNGKTATYISGSGTNSWIFSYEVTNTDSSTGNSNDILNNTNYLYITKLNGSIIDLSGVNKNGNALTTTVSKTTPTENMTTNKVGIDTVKPSKLTLTAKDNESKSITNGSTIGGTDSNMPIRFTSSVAETNGLYYVTVNGEVKTNWESSFGTIQCSAESNEVLDFTITAKQRDVAGNISEETTFTVRVDRSEIALESITTSIASGTYTIGQNIPLTMTFSKQIKITSPITLTLNATNSGSPITVTIPADSSFTNTKTGTYTVKNGDETPEILNITKITGTVADDLGKSLTVTNNIYNRDGNSINILEEISNLAASRQITIDTIKPLLLGISTTTADGWYKAGSKIAITLQFDSDIKVGTTKPSLRLSSGGIATFSSNSGQEITFLYDVIDGNSTTSKNLYVSSFTGTISDQAGNTYSAKSTDYVANNIKKVNTTTSSAIGIDTAITPIIIKNNTIDITNKSYRTNPSLSYYSDTTLTVNWVADSGCSSSCKYSINNANDETIINNGTILCNLVNGVSSTYVIKITKTDEAGNVATAQSEIVLDGEDIKLESITSATSNGTYSTGTNIPITLNFNKAIKITSPLNVTLNNGKTITFSTTNSLSQSISEDYIVSKDEDTTAGNVLAVSSITGTIQDNRGTSKQITDSAWTTVLSNAANLSDSKAIKIDTLAPNVSSISTTTANGWYKAGDIIQIIVTFDETVYVTGTPTLSMSSSGTARYLSGSGTNNLIFTYSVESGETTNSSANLKVSSLNAIGSIADIANNKVTTINETFNESKAIGIDTNITEITITNASENITGKTKTYYETQTLQISGLTDNGSGINQAKTTISVNGSTPTPITNNGSTECVFEPGLKVTNIINITKTDNAGNVATATATVVIDGEEIMLESITTTKDSGTYNAGTIIPITLNFNKEVSITTAISMTLNNGKTLSLGTSSTASKAKTVNYTIASGEDIVDALTIQEFTAGVVKDARNTTKNLSELYESTIKLSDTKSIHIDTVAPMISNITTAMADGWYKASSRIPIKVKFNEDVIVSSAPTLTLNTNGVATYSSSSGSELTFIYTVGSSESTTAKNLYVKSYSGTITDNAGNTFSASDSVIGSIENIKTSADATISAQIGIDTTIPNISIKNNTIDITGKTFKPTETLTHKDGLVYLSTQTLTVSWATDTGSGIESCTYSINGENKGNVSNGGNISCPAIANVNSIYLVTVTMSDFAGNKTESSCEISVDGEQISLDSFTSTVPNGIYKTGNQIPIILTFNKAVKVTTQIKMNLNNNVELTIPTNSTYSTTKTATYTVSQTDTNIDTALDVASISSGVIVDERGSDTAQNLADLFDNAVSLSDSKAIKIDTVAPQITSITTKSTNGWYNENSMINIKLTFNEDVKVGLTSPTLRLSSGGTAIYSNGSGKEMTFIYTVGHTDSTTSQNLYVNGITGQIVDQANNGYVSTSSDFVINNIKDESNNIATIGIDTTITPVQLKIGSVVVNGQSFCSSQDITVSWTADTGSASTCTYSLNGAAFLPITNGGTISCPLVAGTVTPYTIKIKKTDTAGNSYTTTGAITVDGEEIKLEAITADVQNGTYKAGDEIMLTLTFNKAIKVTAPISIALNNGKTLTIPADATYSTNKNVTYTIGLTDTNNVSPLMIESITTGTVMDIRGNDTQKTVNSLLAGANNLDTTKSIYVDTVAPVVTSISTDNANGWYKTHAMIKVTVNFNEPIKVVGSPQLSMSSNGKAVYLNGSGTNSLAFTYTVDIGESTGTSKNLSVIGLTGKITDLAGNEISNITGAFSPAKTIGIDTAEPKTPTITGLNNTVLDASALTLGNFGEVTAGSGLASYTISINGVANTFSKTTTTAISFADLPETIKSILTVANGDKKSFTITAYETDNAGNFGGSDALTFTVDTNPAKLASVTANKMNETLKSGKELKVTLTFSKEITSKSNLTVNLNNGVSLTSWTTSDNLSFTSTYTVGTASSQDTNASALKITSVSGTVTDILGTQNLSDLWTNNATYNLSSYNIKVDTIAPSFISYNITSSYNESTGVEVTYTFSEEITKGSGKGITLQRQRYAAPIILTPSQFLEYKSQCPEIANYYERGVNGVYGVTLGNPASASTAHPECIVDDTIKYILKYDYAPTDSTLVSYYEGIGYYDQLITVENSMVSISNNALSINIPSSMLVTGETYTLSVEDDLVQDFVGNPNGSIANKTFTTSDKPQAPIIRINRISGRGDTAKATTYRIDTITPDAIIVYSIGDEGDAHISFKAPTYVYHGTTTQTINSIQYKQDPYDGTSGDNITKYPGHVTWRGHTYYGNTMGLGSSNDFLFTTQALKKGSGSTTYTGSDYTYDRASKTTLKTSATIASGTYKFKVFRGGDNPSGSNTVKTFQLSWDEKSIGSGAWTAGTTVNDALEIELEKYGMILAENNQAITWSIPVDGYFHGLACDTKNITGQTKLIWKWQQGEPVHVEAGKTATDNGDFEMNYHDYNGGNF